jgi:hypothetical protein
MNVTDLMYSVNEAWLHESLDAPFTEQNTWDCSHTASVLLDVVLRQMC